MISQIPLLRQSHNRHGGFPQPSQATLSPPLQPEPLMSGRQGDHVGLQRQAPQFGLSAAPLVSPSFWSSLANPLTKGAVAGGGILGMIGVMMSVIESSEITKLAVSDVGAMVIPRTWSEAKQRGFDAARETGLREIAGTFTNVYLVGWLTALSLVGMGGLARNPKALDYWAWIDANTLTHMGNTTGELLEEARKRPMTARDVRKAFLDKMFTSMERADGHSNRVVLPGGLNVKDFLPFNDRLNPTTQKELIQILLGEVPGYSQHAFNVEAQVAKAFKDKDVQERLRAGIEAFDEAFRSKRGIPAGQALNQEQANLWHLLRQGEADKLTERLKLGLRRQLTGRIRGEEAGFVDMLYDKAWKQGLLSDEIHMLGADNKPLMSIGRKPLRRTIRQLKYYMEEYLHRAMADPITGEISHNVLDGKAIDAIQARLMGSPTVKEGGSLLGRLWRSVMPSMEDGLIPYVFKAKRLFVGVPLLISLAIGSGFVYYNNRLTAKKYKGKTFFPGEGVPTMDDAMRFAGQARRVQR